MNAWIILQFMTGVFFTITGYRKCFRTDVALQIQKVFDRHHVPYWMQYMVVIGEFAGGLGLLFGVLPRFAAIGLLPIMAGAYVMDTWPAVKDKQVWTCALPGEWPRPGDYTKLISNALCTPEAQLFIILIALALSGGGYKI